MVFYLMVSGSCLAGTVEGTLKLSVRAEITIYREKQNNRGSAGEELCVGQVRGKDKEACHVRVLERNVKTMKVLLFLCEGLTEMIKVWSDYKVKADEYQTV